MRTIKEILRLRWEAGLSYQAIAVSCRKGQTTVRDYVLRAQAAELSWPLPEGMDEEALEQLLFPPPAASSHRRPESDWAAIHQELRRKGVTLALLWQEYKAAHPDGYQHSRFCQLYQQWASTLEPVLRTNGGLKARRGRGSPALALAGCAGSTSAAEKGEQAPATRVRNHGDLDGKQDATDGGDWLQ